jgi:DNA-directed RNA polymerase II subunit RPB1
MNLRCFVKTARNTDEPFKDSRQLAVNIPRIIDGVIGASGGPGVEPNTARDDLSECAELVRRFCTEIPYIYYNDDWMKAGGASSDTSKDVTWLVSMQVRAGLCSRELTRRGISLGQLQAILSRARLIYSKALVEPGSAVGVLAAMGFGEPLMQQMMDAHRQSAAGGSSASGTKRAKEVFNVKDTEAMVAPEMILQFAPEIASNKADIQKIANNLEVIPFSTFILGQSLIFVENYGKPIHPAFSQESAIITDFENKNPLLKPPGNLLHFCIRYELDKTQLILKNMEVEHLAVKLKTVNTDLFVVYTPKNSPRVIVRVYVRASHFKTPPGKPEMEALDRSIQAIILRGVPGIIRAAPIKLVRHKVTEDGAIAMDTDRWGVKTAGTNIPLGLFIPGVVKELIFSNSIQEIFEMFGIEAARSAVINECRRMLPACNYRHYDTYASLITQKGYPTSISKTGMKDREPTDVLLNMGYSNPAEYLETAVTRGIYNEVSGVSSSLSVGTVPRIGSNYTRLEINEKFILENASSANKEFDELFDM